MGDVSTWSIGFTAVAFMATVGVVISAGALGWFILSVCQWFREGDC